VHAVSLPSETHLLGFHVQYEKPTLLSVVSAEEAVEPGAATGGAMGGPDPTMGGGVLMSESTTGEIMGMSDPSMGGGILMSGAAT